MSAFHDNVLIGSSSQGYQIERSLRFNSVDSAYLNRTPASAGNRKTWSVSFWLKRSALGTYQMPFSCYQSTGGALALIFNTDNTLEFYQYNAAYQMRLVTSQVFRDPSSWYHFVFSVDTTQATASNRVKIYVNGTQITAFSTATYPTQNNDLIFNYAQAHAIGMYAGNNQYYFDGLITEFHFIDGQALTPSSFGETDAITGVWKPKRYSGTYGTNGFYLNFADNSGITSTTLGKDSSGNGNNWTPNNFSVTAGSGNDSLIDTPTPYADGGNGRGNYCTWSPLKTGTNLSPEDGNLFARMQSNGSGINQSATATIYVSSGKWYWEGTSYNTVSGYGQIFGIASTSFTSLNSIGSTNQTYGYEKGGTKTNGTTISSYGASYTSNDVIGVALDLDAGTLVFYKNGISQGTAFTGLSGTFTPYCGLTYSGGGPGFYTNFGQRPFAYTPPAGFLALNTQNLPEPTIKKPSSYMDVRLYTGNSATQSITGLEFSPDLVWIKGRSAPYNNALFDAIRGARNVLISNSTASEGAEPVNASLTSFDTSGFTLGGGTPTYAAINAGSTSYVAWCWDESATPGFDIVTYTGNGTARTIAHSLGVAPSMVIVKDRSAATDWSVWSKPVADSLGASYGLFLQSTANAGSYPGIFNSTAPTSSVFSVGTSLSTNTNGNNYVAYLWSEVAGFSKFGSYTGNGSSDGPFVYCGFRPRWVMMKSSSINGSNWRIFDTARDPANVMIYKLSPNNSDAEYTDANTRIDFTSNGFKLRETAGDMNSSGATYVFAAFAEFPAKYSLAR